MEKLHQEDEILKFENINMITGVDAYFRNEDTINGRPADITDFPTLSKRWKNI